MKKWSYAGFNSDTVFLDHENDFLDVREDAIRVIECDDVDVEIFVGEPGGPITSVGLNQSEILALVKKLSSFLR